MTIGNKWREANAACRCILTLLVFFSALSAQTNSGRIIGVIRDASGAVVPKAEVTAVNADTGVRSNSETADDGTYQILDLPVGRYSVLATAAGLAQVQTKPAELNINQSLRIDLTLGMASISQTVEVSDAAVQVETVNPTVGGTVTGAPIQNLPLNGRDTLSLALTQAGVTPAPDSSGNVTGTSSFSIAGGRSDAITYLIDGGINNAVTDNSVVFNPNPDAVAEFRILTNNYTAEYGRNGGGTITLVTKSGTNQLHGTLFEFLRNDAMNANDFFDNEKGQPRPVLKRNQFGGTLGGPIVIPRLLNGKDKLFFFFAYQGQRQSQRITEPQVTVYRPAEINGDFSRSFTDASGNLGPDPGVASFLQANPYFQPDPTRASLGIIDPSKIDPVAKAYIAAGLIPSSPSGTIFPQGAASDNIDQYTGRIDWYASSKDRVSLTLGSNKENNVNPFSANVPGFIDGTKTFNQTANIGYTRTFTPTLLNEAHIVAERYKQNEAPISHPGTPPSLGIGINADLFYGPSILTFVSGMTVGFNPNTPRVKADNTYAATDILTWTKGKHTWRFGGSYNILQENTIYSYNGDGAFDFGSYYPVASGNDLADFLLGAPDNYIQAARAPNNEHQFQATTFAQDEWRVSRRLTLTLGLRYEYTQPEKDTRGYTYSIIPGLNTTRFSDMPLGLVVPGDKGAPRGWYFPDYTNIAPRLGFAYDLFGDGKTSIRGGAGKFYDTINGLMSDWANGYLPWYPSANLYFVPQQFNNGPNTLLSDPYGSACPSPDPTSTYCTGPLGVPDPYPSRVLPKGGSILTQGATFPYGGSYTFVNPHLKTPYIYQYNLSVQRQLTSGLVAEAGYVGSSSHHLMTWVDSNPFVPGTGSRLLNIQTGADPNVNGYGTVITFDGRTNANYNGLLLSLTKSTGDVRNWGHAFFTVSYTWSHNLDDGSGISARTQQVSYFKPHQFYSNSDFDLRQRLAFSGGWEPKISRFWAGGPRKLTDGWNLYFIGFAQSGTPLDLYLNPVINTPAAPSPTDPGSSGYGDPELERPDVNSQIQKFNPRRYQTINGNSGNYYFNPNNFSVNPCIAASNCPIGFYGTFQRNSIFGPGRTNLDLSLEKVTTFAGEKVKLTFRAEAFNIFNHPQFQNPGYRYQSSTLGQVTQTYDPRILQLSMRFGF